MRRFILALSALALLAEPAFAATRIIEYGFPTTKGGYPLLPAGQKITAQTPITATGTSAQSAAFNVATNMVCVQSDEAVYVAFGASPTATTSDYRLQAGQEQCWDLTPNGGAGWKVAVRT
jgi:hypothetical protein